MSNAVSSGGKEGEKKDVIGEREGHMMLCNGVRGRGLDGDENKGMTKGRVGDQIS